MRVSKAYKKIRKWAFWEYYLTYESYKHKEHEKWNKVKIFLKLLFLSIFLSRKDRKNAKAIVASKSLIPLMIALVISKKYYQMFRDFILAAEMGGEEA